MQAIGYCRVSSEEQAESGLGLEAQREKIKAYCVLKGLELVEVFEDAAVSGGKPLDRRENGSRLLSVARRTKCVVVCAKLDRLFRSVSDAAGIIDEFGKKGIQLVAIAEGFDMTSPYGVAMAQMASVFAQLERAMIRERTKNALAVKRGRGERISRHAPYGGDFTENGEVVENAFERGIIERMKEMRGAGLSYRGIATRLNDEGIATKRGGRWVHMSVKGILERCCAA
jgi:DNA invertase Pin-like site-specific DNA recombinase